MKNGHLIIDGVTIADTDLDAFKTFDTFLDWYTKIWDAVDKEYGNKNGMNIDADVFDKAYCDKLQAVRERLVEAQQAARAADEMAKPIVIGDKTYTKLNAFQVLYAGWECDSEAWVVEEGAKYGPKHIIMTNHGQPYLATPADVQAKIEEYKKAIEASEMALWVLAH